MPPRMSYGSEKDRIVSSMILPTIFQAVLLFAVFLLETTLPSGNLLDPLPTACLTLSSVRRFLSPSAFSYLLSSSLDSSRS